MNRLRSSGSSTFSPTTGSVKLGHPVPESNLVSDEKSADFVISPAITAPFLDSKLGA
jgi:hypothetical protein